MNANSNKNQRPNVGGQAIIEGVMMRSPHRVAYAARTPSGKIETRSFDSKPWVKRNWFLGLPIIRGTVAIIEMLYIGFDALKWSSEVAIQDESEPKSNADDPQEKPSDSRSISNWEFAVSMIVALAVGLGLFAALPIWIADITGLRKHPLYFNLLAGTIRTVLFLLYIFGISLLPDIKRIFEYHGAEHKTIFTYEAGLDLIPENTHSFTTFHPRCGTSFLIIVVVISIILYAFADYAFLHILGFAPAYFMRLGYHLLIFPLVAGFAYEALKLSAKLSEKSFIGRMIVAPGLALQRITTAPPDDEQIAVAIAALKESLLNGL